jgi:hypothetical protein
MLDTILKIVALAAFIVSLAVLVIWVPSPDLVTVIVVVVAMAIYDFFLRPYLRNRNGRGRV